MGAGGWLGGVLFDATGSYEMPFLVGVTTNAFNVVLIGSLIAIVKPLTLGLDSLNSNSN